MNDLPIFLLASANDHDDQAQYLRNLPEEFRQITEALDKAKALKLCDYVYIPNATLKQILDKFQEREYHNRIAVFHYGGHANSLQLLLETNDGRVATADAVGFAAFLSQQHGLELVFLNGCSTQFQVESLLDANVPMVIATSQAIDDKVAMDFASRFYRGLVEGLNVNTAYKQAEAAARTATDGDTRNLYLKGTAQTSASVQQDRWPWDLYFKKGAEAEGQWNLPDAVGDHLFPLPRIPAGDLPPEPFRHLSWFTDKEAEIFFGRNYQIRQLYDRVTEPFAAPIVLLYGQAGVGKSSLLDAGLTPRLKASHNTLYLRRNQNLGLLGTIMQGLSLNGGEAVELASAWRAHEKRHDKPLVLILDQVEELFTRSSSDSGAELKAFLEALEKTFAIPSTRPRGRMILGFRKEWGSEIEQRLKEHKIPHSKVFLEPLDRRGIIQAIMGVRSSPRLIQQYELSVEDGLAEVIANELSSDPSSPVAPTLQVLLTKMWAAARSNNRANPVFNLELYRGLKKQGILLGDFLDQQLSKLKEAKPDAVDSGLALDVLAFHTTILGTAEQRTETEINNEYGHLSHALPQLLEKLKELYLLADPPQDRSEEGAAKATRLAHDTLAPSVRARYEISVHPGQRARRILENRSPEWRDNKEGTALGGRDLATVEAGADGMRCWSPDEKRLIEASRTARARLEEIRAQQERRNSFIRWAGIAGAVVIAIIAAVAWWQRGIAKEAEQKALARQLTAQANVLANSQNRLLPRRVLLALEANRLFPSQESTDALRSALDLLPIRASRFKHDGPVMAAQFSPKGDLLATGSDMTARVWDIATGNEIAHLKHDYRVHVVAFSGDGRYLATGSGESYFPDSKGHMKVWDFQNRIEIRVPDLNASILNLVFMPDNSSVVVEMSNSVQVVSLAGPRPQITYWDDSTNETARVISPDGKFLAVSHDLVIHVHDLANKRIVSRFDYSPERGNHLATGDASDQERELTPEKKQAQNMAFNKQGSLLAIADSYGFIHVWDWASRKEVSETRGSLMAWAPALVFSPDGRYAAKIDLMRFFSLWDIDTDEELFSMRVGNEQIFQAGLLDVKFLSDSKSLIVTGGDFTSRLFRLLPEDVQETGPKAEEILRITPEAAIYSVALSPDSRLVATGDEDGWATIWELKSAREERMIEEAREIHYSPSGRYIIALQADGVKVFEADSFQPVSEYRSENKLGFILSNNDDYLAMEDSDGLIKVFELASGKAVGTFRLGSNVREMALSSARPVLLAITSDRSTHEIDLKGGNVNLLPEFIGKHSAGLSGDGRYLVTSVAEPIYSSGEVSKVTLEVYEVDTGRLVMSLKGEPANLGHYLSRDGRYLATVKYSGRILGEDTGDFEILFREVGSGREIKRLFSSSSYGFRFSNDNIVAVMKDTAAQILNLETGEEFSIETLAKIERGVLSHDSKYLLTISADQTARVWDLSTRALQASMKSNISMIQASFSPDGKYIIFTGYERNRDARRDQVMGTYRARFVLRRSEDLVAEACRRITRNLTPDEWKEYFGQESYNKTCPHLP